MLRSPPRSGGLLRFVIQGLFIVRPPGGVIEVLVHSLMVLGFKAEVRGLVSKTDQELI